MATIRLAVSDRFSGNLLPAWARLGPLSVRDSLTRHITQTVDREWLRGRSPNRAAWRFPDWTAVGSRFGAFYGIRVAPRGAMKPNTTTTSRTRS